jgi:hypothetical protein
LEKAAQSPVFDGRADANQQTHQMCPFGTDFKHFWRGKAETLRFPRNISSIMRTKLLSIMPQDAGAVSSP